MKYQLNNPTKLDHMYFLSFMYFNFITEIAHKQNLTYCKYDLIHTIELNIPWQVNMTVRSPIHKREILAVLICKSASFLLEPVLF